MSEKETQAAKAAIRKEAMQKRDALSEAELAAMSAKIAAHLFSLPEYRDADAVCCYASFGSEVETAPVMRRVLADGKALFAPRITDAHARQMLFFKIGSEEDLQPGYRNIPEPDDERCTLTLRRWCEEQNDGGKRPYILMLMPGLAFDKTRTRIGHGGGFYDTYLHDLQKMPGILLRTLALAFSCQILPDTLPATETDIRPEEVLTEQGLVRLL